MSFPFPSSCIPQPLQGTPEMSEKCVLLLEGQQERIRLGSSFGDSTRINEEAEGMATEAREHKKAKRYLQAYKLYSAMIHLDPYNHEYFHQMGK